MTAANRQIVIDKVFEATLGYRELDLRLGTEIADLIMFMDREAGRWHTASGNARLTGISFGRLEEELSWDSAHAQQVVEAAHGLGILQGRDLSCFLTEGKPGFIGLNITTLAGLCSDLQSVRFIDHTPKSKPLAPRYEHVSDEDLAILEAAHSGNE